MLVKAAHAFVFGSCSFCVDEFCIRIGGSGIVECLRFFIASQSQQMHFRCFLPLGRLDLEIIWHFLIFELLCGLEIPRDMKE